jgi:hypothetical protein
MNDERSGQGWWSTLPGVLTASAATITAIGGLVLALTQAGIFHGSTPATPPIAASSPASTEASAKPVNTSTTTVAASASIVAATSVNPAPAVQASQQGNGGEIGSNMTYFVGSWQNLKRDNDGILKIQIRIAESTMYVRAWGRCRPTDCDWGEVQAVGFGSNVGSDPGRGARVVTAQFKNNIRQVALTIHPAPNDHLRVEVATNFVDQSGRAPLARIFLFDRM